MDALLEQNVPSSFVLNALVWARQSVWTILLAAFLAICLYDQVMYVIYKGSIAGPPLKIWPIMGPFLESVNPKFDQYKAKWASGPLSCVSVFHKFVVIASTRDLARKIFNSPAFAKPCVVDVAIKILRPTNWVFMDGKQHVDYRRSLNGLFTRKALGTYLPPMHVIHTEYLERFVAHSKESPKPFMHEFREFMCAVSLKTFCGDYITKDQIAMISDNYYQVTEALELVNFPIILPFTKPWYGKKVADFTMKIFEDCAAMSKKNMAAGGAIGSTIDEWVTLMLQSKKFEKENPNMTPSERRSLVREFTNKEISETIFTFLFASQDATSSACTWLFQVLGDRPDIMEKIREEQLRLRDNDVSIEPDLDLVDKMTYTNMVVKEILRYRPPVIMVPYVCKKPYPISPEYTAPKGSMVIPTLWPALHDPEVYENPDEFIPERWVEGSKASLAQSNWLVFGTGPHVCIGQNYVMMNLVSMIGKACMLYDWKHTVTAKSEEIRVFATIFPEDDCILKFTRRENPTVM